MVCFNLGLIVVFKFSQYIKAECKSTCAECCSSMNKQVKKYCPAWGESHGFLRPVSLSAAVMVLLSFWWETSGRPTPLSSISISSMHHFTYFHYENLVSVGGLRGRLHVLRSHSSPHNKAAAHWDKWSRKLI